MKDFQKQKLKVGKKKPIKSNATNTNFSTKTLTLQTQLKSPSLSNYLSLLRHHQPQVRKQALGSISQILELHSQEIGTILKQSCSLMVDESKYVRSELISLLKKIDNELLNSYITLIAVHIHAAMTHIQPAIRADSTLFLQIVMEKCPLMFVRSHFKKTLNLFFPLLGWPLEGKKSKNKVQERFFMSQSSHPRHLNALHQLLLNGLQIQIEDEDVAFHVDSFKFLIPKVSNPFETELTDDVEARKIAVDEVRDGLLFALELCSKEGGESGRLAAKLFQLVN